jgi:hypothetical protein
VAEDLLVELTRIEFADQVCPLDGTTLCAP